MGRIVRVSLIVAAVLIMLFAEFGAPVSSGCTAFYAGEDTTVDGSTIIARSNDLYKVAPAYAEVIERVENEPGRYYLGVDGFSYPLPDTTYRRICTPLASSLNCAKDEAIVINEYGLLVDATVTAYANDAALNADPLVVGGVHEDVMAGIMGACCKTAREAMELIASIIDEYGTSENNILVTADRNECWYMETYTGHEYCAIKMPKDKVAGYGNEYNLISLEGYAEADIIKSPRLLTLPAEHNFDVYTPGGNLDLWSTYSGTSVANDNSHARTWVIHRLFSPTTISDEYSTSIECPLFYNPDAKVSVLDIMDYYRNRFEGTSISDSGIRPISTETSSSIHIAQIMPGAPDDMFGIVWLCLGCANFSTFVPIFSSVDEIYSEYADTTLYREYQDNAYFTFKKLDALCENYADRGAVRSYWRMIEGRYVPMANAAFAKALEIYQTSPSQARDYATRFCLAYQEQMNNEAKHLISEVEWSIMINDGPKATERVNLVCSIDAKLMAEQSGWTVSEQDGTIVMKKGTSEIDIKPGNGLYNIKTVITVNGVSSSVATELVNGTVYIPASYLADIGPMSSEDYLKWVDSQNGGSGGSGDTVIIAVIGAAAAVILIVLLALASRKG